MESNIWEIEVSSCYIPVDTKQGAPDGYTATSGPVFRGELKTHKSDAECCDNKTN
eukprot:SAG31_NODE_781_length_12127_cov_34.178334_2_plen_55_part_00